MYNSIKIKLKYISFGSTQQNVEKEKGCPYLLLKKGINLNDFLVPSILGFTILYD
uniref:Uncharacterized protein n=1 Tax=Nelumbo nucifera TaxID=4432 RepID=A0A822YMG8_NELNU|nr:TPA_asm: hypothetical protein HUJ06_009369 [Nelumbo nucifera]